ncbi:MAG: GspH/FimT family pseudopilin [Thermodesulfobacteriota bacterium]
MKSRRKGPRRRTRRAGWTLFEVVAVFLILGLVAAAVLGRSGASDVNLVTQADLLKSHLRYAQSRALNTNAVWYVMFTDQDTYSLYQDGAAHLFLGQDQTVVDLPAGLSVNYGASNVISFDSWGRPGTDALGQNPQAADRFLTLTDGADSVNIKITKNTGYIP